MSLLHHGWRDGPWKSIICQDHPGAKKNSLAYLSRLVDLSAILDLRVVANAYADTDVSASSDNNSLTKNCVLPNQSMVPDLCCRTWVRFGRNALR